MTAKNRAKRGDVESVGYADADKAAAADAAVRASDPVDRLVQAPTPAPDERVAIRLVGHAMTYYVRVTTSLATGPVITELTLAADDGQAVDYAAVRAIPVRRLAYSAAGWIDRAGGVLAFPGDYAETRARPESADPRLSELAWRIESAIKAGEPVRPTVAHDMHVSPSTLDRLIAKARAEGLLKGVELPRRPQPQQRDTTTPAD